MNHEQEISEARKAHLSAKQQLDEAIRNYLEVCERLPEDGDPGILVGWYLVTQEQNPVSGTSSHARATKDYQSVSDTMGLIRYSDAHYMGKVMRNSL